MIPSTVNSRYEAYVTLYVPRLIHMRQSITPTKSGAVVELVWVGKCARDIVRPDGAIAVKASGKDFKNHVCFVMNITDAGKIRRIDEYYNRQWDEGIPEQSYAVMKGKSLKL
jgi:hypothetical protein